LKGSQQFPVDPSHLISDCITKLIGIHFHLSYHLRLFAMPNPFKETNLFEPMNRSNLIYGRIMQSKFLTGTNPNPYEVDPLPVAELEMEDPLSAEYRYYDEPLGMCGVGGFYTGSS
jgi:hypothetical protein